MSNTMESSDENNVLNYSKKETDSDINLNQGCSEFTHKCSADFTEAPCLLIQEDNNNNGAAAAKITGTQAEKSVFDFPNLDRIVKKEKISCSCSNICICPIESEIQDSEGDLEYADDSPPCISSEARRKNDKSVIVDVSNTPTAANLSDLELETKSDFHWICLTRHYKMSPKFKNKDFCAEFTSKILVSKTTQLLFVFSWALSSKSSQTLIGFIQKYYGMFYITLAFYISFYLCIRSTNIIRSIPVAALAFTLNSAILAHLCASIFIMCESYIILIVLLTLLFSYFVVCIVCLGFNKIDVKKQDIFVPIVVSTIVYSLISYSVIKLVHDVDNLLEHIGTVWLPSMLISVLVATGEMQEIQKLLYGLRTPLKETDWIIASNYVL